MNNYTVGFLLNTSHSQKQPLQKVTQMQESTGRIKHQIHFFLPLMSCSCGLAMHDFGEIPGIQRLFVIQENNTQFCATKNQ